MSKSLLEMAAEIVQGQVSRASMSSEEIVSSLRTVFDALVTIKKAETGDGNPGLSGAGEVVASTGTVRAKADPKDSIRDDTVVCLECGVDFKQLTAKHLQTHGLSPREYKKKWGFTINQSLVARSISKARSKAAKKRGLPEQLKAYLDARKKVKDAGAQPTTIQMAQEDLVEENVLRQRQQPTTA